MSSVQEQWIEAHPYLRKIAEFQQVIAEAFNGLAPASVKMPDWPQYFAEYREGVPLLQSEAAALDYAPQAGEMLLAANANLLKRELPEPVMLSAKSLQQHLESGAGNRVAAIRFLLDGDATLPSVGLLRVLGWEALRRSLAQLLKSYAELRDDAAWMRGYCPVCGAMPAMAQLLPQSGEPRMLACGCCQSMWQYRRIGCPFCENEDQNQLAVFTIEQEPLFRLDSCRQCNGYLKTHIGANDLELHLADWTSLHLDVLARQQKLERKSAPLFEV